MPAPKEKANNSSSKLPAGYEAKAGELSDITHDYMKKLACELAQVLNARIQTMLHDTYEQKKDVARWVNAELRRFDLAIKCPKTGRPSILLVQSSGYTGVGRFQLEHKGDTGKRVRTMCPELPQLELMEAPPRREAIQEWQEKMRQQGSGPSRP